MPIKSPDLSVVIVSYNTRRLTTQCINSLFSSVRAHKVTSPALELIIVDNASTDGTVPYLTHLAETHKNVRLILNTANLGFAKANNQGVAQATAPYILLLNSDTVILKDALARLFRFYIKNEQTKHFIGPRLLNKNLTPQPSAARFFSLWVVFAALFLRGDYWGLTRSSPRSAQYVDWISGACIMTKKEYFQQVGGFDESIFMYMEEVDLLYRARKTGLRTYYYPKAKVVHYGSASSDGKTFPILQVYRGFIFFYKKHRSRFHLAALRFILKTKAVLALTIGVIMNNSYLKQTYAQAYNVAGQ